MATKLYLTNLCEFIYDSIIKKGTQFIFDRLEREDYLKVKTEAKIRSFSENANLEDKIILLSKLGMGCAVVLWDKDNEKKKKVEDVVIGYIDTDPNDVTKQIIKDHIFACRDINFIKSLTTISHASNSKVYSINRKFLAIKEKAFTRTLVNKLEAERNIEWYSKTIGFAYDIEEVLEGLKLDMLKFRTLLHLHSLPNGATKGNISKKLNRLNVTGMLNEMHNTNMIKLSGDNNNIASIDTYGYILLEKIFEKFP
mgnify:CR=1 FL=1